MADEADIVGPARRRTAREGVKRRSAERGQRRAEQIMQVAARIFHAQGYAATSMDDIAEAVGLTQGSLYYYMRSKEDLLYKIVLSVHAAIEENLNAALVIGASSLDRLMGFIERQIRYQSENWTQISVYHHDWRHLAGERLADVENSRRVLQGQAMEMVRNCQRDGQISSTMDTRLTAETISAIMTWPVATSGPEQVSADELVKFITTFIRNALTGGERRDG